MFFVVNSFASVCYAILAGVFSAIIHGAVVGLMSPFGLPALTFAFNIVGWVWCLAGGLMSTMFPVEITAITVPEDHIKRVNLSRKMKSKFKAMNLEAITDIFGVKTHQELVAIEKVLSPVLMCWYASIGDIQ
jgi:urea transporter